MSETFNPQDGAPKQPEGAQPLKIIHGTTPPKLVEASIPQKEGDLLPGFVETRIPMPPNRSPITNVEGVSIPEKPEGTPIQAISEADIPRRPEGQSRPTPYSSGIPLPSKLRDSSSLKFLSPLPPPPAVSQYEAIRREEEPAVLRSGSMDDPMSTFGTKPSPRFDPESKPSVSFVPSFNTAVKMREAMPDWKGSLAVAPPSISFEARGVGEPMQRQVKIVWPKPTGQKPSVPTQGVGQAACQLRTPVQPVATFPGQNIPGGGKAKQVPLTYVPEAKPPVSIRNSQDDALPLPPPPSQMRPAPASAASSMEDPKITVSVERIVFLQRVEKLMANEARIHELENEAGVLRSTISTLGGEVARLKVELEIAKTKKG